MTEYGLFATAIEKIGSTALILFVVWKLGTVMVTAMTTLANTWAGKFLEVQSTQARGMCDLASAVREGQGDQREVLLAVRAMASKLDEVKGWVRDLDGHLRGNDADAH